MGAKADVPDITLAVHIDDTAFVTVVTDGDLSTREGKDPGAMATFVSDLASWRIALLGLLPRLLKQLEPKLTSDVLAAHLRAIEPCVLREKPGQITVHYEDDAGDEATVDILIGGGGPRRAVVHASDTELWRLLEGGGRLSQLVTSRVRVSGDVAYAIELARLIDE